MLCEELPKDQKLLVVREFYLALLGKSQQGKNIALLGSSGTGKTSVIRDYIHAVNKQVLPVYIDLGKISTPPENFSTEFVGSVGFWSLGYISKFEEVLKKKDSFGKAASLSLDRIQNELLKIKPDQRLLVKTAFSFAEQVGKHLNRKVVLCMDNFDNILEMNNFSQIKDIFSLINFNSGKMNFIIASSAVNYMKKNLHGFVLEDMELFNKEQTDELVEKIAGKKISGIFELTKGNPFLSKALAEKGGNAKESWTKELITRDSKIYNHCKNIFDSSLNRARGQSLLKNALKVLSRADMTLSEVARKIYRSAPVTKSVLERLIDVDLVEKKANKFSFADPVLKQWVGLVFNGYDFDFEPDEKIIYEVSKLL